MISNIKYRLGEILCRNPSLTPPPPQSKRVCRDFFQPLPSPGDPYVIKTYNVHCKYKGRNSFCYPNRGGSQATCRRTCFTEKKATSCKSSSVLYSLFTVQAMSFYLTKREARKATGKPSYEWTISLSKCT